MTIDIAADPATVWKTLTDAGELVRWFPFQAQVEPGKDGTMFWGWGEFFDWDHRIDAWEPGKRLRLVRGSRRAVRRARQADVRRKTRPVPVAIEVTLEAHGGSTRLRLVHSGFERGADWDDEFEGISTGWQSELRNLKHYVERHRGHDRFAAMARLSTREARGAAWRRVLADGFGLDPSSLTEGASYWRAPPTARSCPGRS